MTSIDSSRLITAPRFGDAIRISDEDRARYAEEQRAQQVEQVRQMQLQQQLFNQLKINQAIFLTEKEGQPSKVLHPNGHQATIKFNATLEQVMAAYEQGGLPAVQKLIDNPTQPAKAPQRQTKAAPGKRNPVSAFFHWILEFLGKLNPLRLFSRRRQP